ncbi:MAG: diguanylate cyclase, partial [Desulfovermiculus sp.]|nr:diguanylate cyclase [Desulfovermiculus sp.]
EDEGRFVSSNPAWAKMCGYASPQELIESVTDIATQIYYDLGGRESFQQMLEADGEMIDYEFRLRRADGSFLWVAETVRAMKNSEGKIIAYQGFATDISKRKQAQEMASKTKDRLDFALQAANIALWDWNMQTGELVITEQWAEMVGYTLDELEPVSIKTWEDFCHPDDFMLFTERLQEYLDGRSSIYECEVRLRHKAGYWVWVLDRGQVVDWDEQDRPLRISGTHTDITKLKQYEEQLTYLSLHDSLTGLYNRTYLENELDRLAKSRDYPITVICMDVDGLKLINDTLGHHHGDKQLQACAKILLKSFRASDILARIGGDEFAAIMPRTDQKAAERMQRRIQSSIENFNQQPGNHIPLSLSIGLACAHSSNVDLAEIMKQADDRMYQNKLNPELKVRSRIMKSLMASLEERDFLYLGHARRLEKICLHLGEKVSLSSHQAAGLALLARVHDLGKVAIPEHILFKPEPLTTEEWQIMRQHPEKGRQIALATSELAEIADLILKHHERWDGRGYPLGLAGEDIPIECRILAIADAFEVMTTDRPYRKAVPVDRALEEIRKGAHRQFDPHLVKAFIAIGVRF